MTSADPSPRGELAALGAWFSHLVQTSEAPVVIRL